MKGRQRGRCHKEIELEQSELRTRIREAMSSGILEIEPCRLQGKVNVPQSKSMAHRALIMAFLCGDISKVILDERNLSDDVIATREALEKIQAYQKDHAEGERLLLDCKESGSTLRFLIPLVAVLGVPTRFEGRGRLPKRPIKEYERVFEGSGATMTYCGGEGLSLPLEIDGKMRSGEYTLPGNVSSQYISGLLMALASEEGESRICLSTELESEPYVDMTMEVMQAFGCEVRKEERAYALPDKKTLHREKDFYVEADYSQAAFWLVGNYLGDEVDLTNLPEKTAQGDRAIETLLEGLAEAGAENGSHYFEMDARNVPDLVPVFSVAAAATDCETHIVHAERLVLKESDRLAATAGLLRVLGIEVDVSSDGMVIHGKKASDGKIFDGGVIDTHKDHRLVMAAAVAGAQARSVIRIQDPVAVEKSYPSFFEDYIHLGGSVHGINLG